MTTERYNPALFDLAMAFLRPSSEKQAFVPAQGGGAPPMDPAMMAAGGGAPPMDPAVMGGGGAPPMDPAMMAAMMGGGGGEAPPMPVDPAAAPPAEAAPAAGGVTADEVRQIIQETLGQGGAPKEGEKPSGGSKSGGKSGDLDLKLDKMTKVTVAIAKAMHELGLPIDLTTLLDEDGDGHGTVVHGRVGAQQISTSVPLDALVSHRGVSYRLLRREYLFRLKSRSGQTQFVGLLGVIRAFDGEIEGFQER